MCHFLSWVEYDNKLYYLTKRDLKGKIFNQFKKENFNWQEDIIGHGAIRYFYPEIKGFGFDRECTDFRSQKNFPNELIKAIKNGVFSGLGNSLQLLNNKGQAEYEKIEQPAWAEYKKIEQSALAEYKKIEQPALAEYEKIEQSALAEYEKIEQSAFWKIFKQKKYRSQNWL